MIDYRMKSEEITIKEESVHSPEARMLLSELSRALSQITGCSGERSFDPDQMDDPRACFAIARDDSGAAVGCGGFRPVENTTAEMKRVYSKVNGKGIGKRILAFLEGRAAEFDFDRIIVETRVVNENAVHFYLQNGYQVIPNYGKYVGHEEAICFEKLLKPSSMKTES